MPGSDLTMSVIGVSWKMGAIITSIAKRRRCKPMKNSSTAFSYDKTFIGSVFDHAVSLSRFRFLSEGGRMANLPPGSRTASALALCPSEHSISFYQNACTPAWIPGGGMAFPPPTLAPAEKMLNRKGVIHHDPVTKCVCQPRTETPYDLSHLRWVCR